MPFGIKPVCSSCRVTTSTLWRKGANGEILCNSCGLKQVSNGGKDSSTNGSSTTSKNENGSANGSQNNNSQGGPVLRKSARIKPGKSRVQTTTKAVATKGKSRRFVFKKSQPVKAPQAVATVVTGTSIFHDGQYYQLGDIVSLVDHDGGTFYAQLRGFMVDQYGEKSAVITWLLPTENTPQGRFDASTYILGPEEDIPRKMDYMDFVCHAPSEYFKAQNTPYPVVGKEPNLCFIWTSLGPEIRTTPSLDEIFGVKDEGEETSSTSELSSTTASGGGGGGGGGKNSRDKDGKDKDKNKDDRKTVKMECD